MLKLPLLGVVIGLLLGIVAAIVIAPDTAQGIAFILLVAILLVTAIVLLVDRLRSKRTTPPEGKDA